MNRRVPVAGLQVDSVTEQQLLDIVARRLQDANKTFIVTAYSEFLYQAVTNPNSKDILNSADITVPDGIGILWAEKYLQVPLTTQSFAVKILQAFLQLLYTGLGILLNPQSVKQTFPQTIVGAELFWSLSKLAEQHNYSIYLLGGFGDTPELVATRLKEKFPKLRIVGYSNKQSSDPSIVDDVRSASPDILFVALGPMTQELWIANHIQELPIKLAIGLGGTFDYVAGKVAKPPQWMRQLGLEWAFRLITQPTRWRRIWTATFGLCQALLRYKIFASEPLRQNVVTILINQQGKVLVCKRNPDQPTIAWFGRTEEEAGFRDYWQFPQGGIDKGESKDQAAIRELWEETGITNATLRKFSEHTHTYEWLNAKRPLWGNPSHFRGQKQYIAYFEFTGMDSEIKVDQHEFVAYRWVEPKDLLTVLHKERHGLATIVQNDLAEHKMYV